MVYLFLCFANSKNDVYWQLCIVWCMYKPIWVFFLMFICCMGLHVFCHLWRACNPCSNLHNRGDIFISNFIATIKVCQGQIYNLYYDATLAFQGDEFWSFHELLQGDHQQIHTKWVIDYNTKSIKNLAFVINGEKIWVHWGILCPNTNVMMPMTQATFAIVIQLVKVECKRKSFNPFYFYWYEFCKFGFI